MRPHPLLATTAAALTLLAFNSASAQSYPASSGQSGAARSQDGPGAENRRGARRGQASRDSRTPEQLIAAVQPLLVAGGVQCQAVEAKSLGKTADDLEVFEAACATGPGYMLTTATPPAPLNCLALAAQYAEERVADPDAESTTAQCTIERNLNALAAVTPLAQAAGIACTIDAAAWIGRVADGDDRYEIGCAGVDGFWLDVPATGTASTAVLDCLSAARPPQTCKFTTAEEQAATVATKLAGTAAPACSVTGGRFAGQNSSGRFFEAKCADNSGFMFRVDSAGAFQQAYPCANAQSIGGGCTLSDMGAVLATAKDRRTQLLTAAGFNCASTGERVIGIQRGGITREVVELSCSDRPLGLVALVPTEEDEGLSAFDCLTAAGRRLICTLTSVDVVKASLSRQLKAGLVACDATEFRVMSAILTRDGDDAGDRVEVKCAQGISIVADVPIDRSAAATAVPCSEFVGRDESCTL